MNLPRATTIDDLRRAARRRLPRAVFEFIDGGADDECTLRDNRAAFERVRLLPRALVDVSAVDTSATLAGSHAQLPLAISPTGVAAFARHGADVAIARAAAAFGIPYTLSSSATASIERIANEAPGVHWFQPYILRDTDFFWKLVARAQAADYEALVITIDMPIGGKRPRDLRNDFSVPFRYTARNVADFALHPRWAAGMLRHGVPVLENWIGLDTSARNTSAIVSSIGRNYDMSFDWERLAAVRDRWPRRFLVKGILRPEDAERLAGMGCDGIIVSNHGGRQQDGVPATLDVLPAIVRAVGGRAQVLLDSGVRRGADVLKALALGASGAMVGRATLYGAAAAGAPGAHRALEILADELLRAMRLCGVRSIAEIDAGLVAPGPERLR